MATVSGLQAALKRDLSARGIWLKGTETRRLVAGAHLLVVALLRLWFVLRQLIGSILLEKAADSFVLALTAGAVALAYLPVSNVTTGLRLAAGMLGLGFMVRALMSARVLRIWQQLIRRYLQQIAWLRIHDDETLPQGRLGDLLVLACTSALIWLLSTVGLGTLDYATGLSILPLLHIALRVAIQLGNVLTAAPGNLGLLPLVYAGVFGIFGVPSSSAVILGMLLHVLAFGAIELGLLGACVSVWVAKSTPSADSQFGDAQ